jgi:RNA polymerase sigma factor (sigma-70 family)
MLAPADQRLMRRFPRTRNDTTPMRDDPAVTGLVTRARNGEEQAWDALVERYAPLIWSICRRHRLGGAEADDVGQRVWLQLVDHLDNIREPAALPGWLATTTRRECARAQRAAHRAPATGDTPDAQTMADPHARTAEQQLLAAERHAALRAAFARLPPCCQQLITLLIQDPPLPYATISATLNIPAGSIGPNRGRCLEKLRRDPAIAALISAAAETTEREPPGTRLHGHDEQSMASSTSLRHQEPQAGNPGAISACEPVRRAAPGRPARPVARQN